jgi:hypothetical protein
VVPKHRRTEKPSLASVGAPVYAAEFDPDAAGYGHATATDMRSRFAGGGYPASSDYYGVAAEPGWAAAPAEGSWQDWHDWQDWGPPPTLHPDHPSAPVPRVLFPADHPSGPLPASRAPALPSPAGPGPGGQDVLRPLPAAWEQADGLDSRGSAAQPPRDPGRTRNSGRHAAITASTSIDYGDRSALGQMRPEVNGFQRQPGLPRREGNGVQPEPGLPRRDGNGLQREPGLPRRDTGGFQREPSLPRRDTGGFQREPGLPRRNSNGYQRQIGPGWQETTDYRRETGPFGPGPGPANGHAPNGHAPNGHAPNGHAPNGRSPNADSLWTAGQARALANGHAAQLAQEAQDNATAIRDAAAREAAELTQEATAIREAAEREAAGLRARLESMLGELNQMSAYATDAPAAPAMPAITPVLPGARPDLPGKRPARPAAAPDLPGARPDLPGKRSAAPGTAPDLPGARPDLPGRASVRPVTKPRPDTRPGTGPARSAGPRTATASKSLAHGRQAKVMRAFVWATAGMLAFAAIAGATEIAEHGFSFFVFREGGVGETPGSTTDQQFEAHLINGRGARLPAAHSATAPTGKHHKTSS